MAKFATVKQMSEIRKVLDDVNLINIETITKECKKIRESIIDGGVLATKKKIVSQLEELEMREKIYSRLPPQMRVMMPSPKDKIKELPPLLQEAIQALEKRNEKKFEVAAQKFHEWRLENETEEKIVSINMERLAESLKDQIESFEKFAGKTFKVLAIKEGEDEIVKVDLEAEPGKTSTITMDCIEKIEAR
jgi:hypothetical protein